MDWQAVQIGVAEMLVCGAVGLAVVYGSFLVFSRFSRKLDEEKEIKKGNRAVAIALGGSLVGTAVIVREALYPIGATIQNAAEEEWALDSVLSTLGYAFLFLVITAAVALAVVGLAARLFTAMTRGVDEKSEIARGNTAAAIFFASVIIAISLFAAEGAGTLAKALIPQPGFDGQSVSAAPIEVVIEPEPAGGPVP